MRDEIVREVEQFLYREARLLDERRFHEWLAYFTDDVRYWMSSRSTRYPKSSKAIASLDPHGSREEELARDDELAILDETKETLRGRVARLDTGMAWAEDPPSRTRHLIVNIEVEGDGGASELTVYSNFLVYRSRFRDRAGFLRGRPAGCPEARRRRMEDRPPSDRPRSERAPGQERERLLLSRRAAHRAIAR